MGRGRKFILGGDVICHIGCGEGTGGSYGLEVGGQGPEGGAFHESRVGLSSVESVGVRGHVIVVNVGIWYGHGTATSGGAVVIQSRVPPGHALPVVAVVRSTYGDVKSLRSILGVCDCEEGA